MYLLKLREEISGQLQEVIKRLEAIDSGYILREDPIDPEETAALRGAGRAYINAARCLRDMEANYMNNKKLLAIITGYYLDARKERDAHNDDGAPGPNDPYYEDWIFFNGQATAYSRIIKILEREEAQANEGS